MLRPSSILRKNGAHLKFKKKDVWKKKSSYHSCFEHARRLFKHYQFASSFEQWIKLFLK
jgi:hypothetical protein